MHPKTYRATYSVHISPGSHECGESGRAIGRVQAFSLVAFKVQSFSLAGRGNQSSPLRRQIALSEPISFGEASRPSYQDRWTISTELCTIPSPFTARFQGTVFVATALVPE